MANECVFNIFSRVFTELKDDKDEKKAIQEKYKVITLIRVILALSSSLVEDITYRLHFCAVVELI